MAQISNCAPTGKTSLDSAYPFGIDKSIIRLLLEAKGITDPQVWS